ncbi:MAG TPA: hypothetical protein VEV43_12160, partial [Actinomycetota bacterium]|nr:hypothetical protein [Actinomycetota bacterium]
VDKADQDGNNGCGNDDDFEDDNEGWCGRKPKPAKPEVKPAGPCDADAAMPGTQPCKDDDVKPCDKDATMPGTQPCKDDGSKPCDADATMPGTQPCADDEDEVVPDVEPNVVTHPGQPEVPTVVLGERISRDDDAAAPVAARQPTQPGGSTLPFTGASLLVFVGAGLALMGAGIIAARKR